MKKVCVFAAQGAEMDQVLYVHAGDRSIRGVTRSCVMAMKLRGTELVGVSLEEGLPSESAFVVPVTYRVFREMMRSHGLSFRRRKYETEEERNDAKKQSLEKYRSSQKFRAKQLSRRKAHQTPGVLSAKDVQAIKSSKRTAMALARWYGISLRHIQEVKDGRWDAGGVLVGLRQASSQQN